MLTSQQQYSDAAQISQDYQNLHELVGDGYIAHLVIIVVFGREAMLWMLCKPYIQRCDDQ